MTRLSLYAESLDAVALIESPADRANAHIQTVKAMFDSADPDCVESARQLVPETISLIEAVEPGRERYYLFSLFDALRKSEGRKPPEYSAHDVVMQEKVRRDIISTANSRGAYAPRSCADEEDIWQQTRRRSAEAEALHRTGKSGEAKPIFQALIAAASQSGHCRLLLELAMTLSGLGEGKAAKNVWKLAARQAFAQPPALGLFWLREIAHQLLTHECFNETESILRELDDWPSLESIQALKSELLAELSKRLAADRGEDAEADVAWTKSLAIARRLTDPILRAAALRFAAAKVFP